MNKVFLIGKLTATPEIRYTTNGIAILRFSIAVNRQFTNKEGQKEADFINCVAFKKQAENMAKYLNKGSLISVEGRIQVKGYDDKEGKRRYSTYIMVDNVQFLENKKKEDSQTNQYPEEDPFAKKDNMGVYEEYGDTVLVDDNFLD